MDEGEWSECSVYSIGRDNSAKKNCKGGIKKIEMVTEVQKKGEVKLQKELTEKEVREVWRPTDITQIFKINILSLSFRSIAWDPLEKAP